MRPDWQYYRIYGASSATHLTLRVSHMSVMHYPLTYTVDECIEAWCALVGWKLSHVRGTAILDGRIGKFYFEPSRDENVMDTVRLIARSFRRERRKIHAGRRVVQVSQLEILNWARLAGGAE